MTTTTFPQELHDALAVLGGRKFEPGDVTDALQAVAEDYVRNYVGNFSFLLDLQHSLARKGGLTVGQAKGALNCVRADVARSASVATQAAPLDEPGLYVLDDVVYRVRRSKNSGRCYAQAWVQNSRWEYQAGAIFKLAGCRQVTAEEARAYGKLTGNCIACGRKLTDDQSIDAGYGPVCARNHGWPLPAKAAKAKKAAAAKVDVDATLDLIDAELASVVEELETILSEEEAASLSQAVATVRGRARQRGIR